MWASLWSGPVPLPPRAVCNVEESQTNGVVSSSGEVCSKIDNTLIGKTTAKTISIILRGVVVGEARSGKTCLIRRLRGEDPFVHVENDRSSKNKNLMALIPWKVPDVITNNCQKLYPVEGDEVVQLYVSEGKSFCYTRNDDRAFHKQWSSVLQSQRGKDLDFIVWIIDPRMKNILDFVRDGLDTLFAGNNREANKASDDIKQQPIHVCILLNFRDCIDQTIVGQIQNTIKQVIESYKEDRERQNHVRRCQLQIHTSDSDSTPTILVYESSTSNCYGLRNLLSFISLPYLSNKERNFQRLAEQTRTQHVQWINEMLINKGMEYEEYINQRLVQQKLSPKLPNNHQDSSSGELKSPSRHNIHHQMTSSPGEINLLSRPRRSPGSNSEKSRQQETCTSAKNQHGDADNVSSSVTLSLPALNDTVTRTLFARPNQLFTGRKVTSSSKVPANDSLDLFFSDDDEEEEEADEPPETDENDGSDDEDFFIDIDRKRRVPVAAVRTRTKKMSSNGAGHINPIVNEDNASLEANIDERKANYIVTCEKLSDNNVADEGVDDERNNEQTPSEIHNGIKTHTSERYDDQPLEADTEDEYADDDYSYPISEGKSKEVNSIGKSHKKVVLDTNNKTASLVLDSDDEESLAGDIQQRTPGDKVIKPAVPSTSSMTKHNSSTPVTKSGIPMSSAARAAIDAARKEAEAMMNVQLQQTNNVPTTIQKLKKKIKKRNKDEKKEKKKKKDKMQSLGGGDVLL